MKTRVIDLQKEYEHGITEGARWILQGELVAFPTETVYGLGANALNPTAVRKIFQAKGRPGDNPLIVHVASKDGVAQVAEEIPDKARQLMKTYFPGPLTLVFKRRACVPAEVTAGLDTVAVRMPEKQEAHDLIRRCGVPIAAPSANLSGRPSPTTARHVLEDMNGRIPLILDGGEADIGLESTVVDITTDTPVLLRPGAVTLQMLQKTVGDVRLAHGVLEPVEEDEKVLSPGMKHKHYAPSTKVRLVRARHETALVEGLIQAYDEEESIGKKPVLFVSSETQALCGDRRTVVWGSRKELGALAHALFAQLRALDKGGYTLILCEAVSEDGIGLAIMNRAIRAAGFDIVIK